MSPFTERPNLNQDNAGGLITRNIYVKGRRTSIKLEIEMWNALADAATQNRMTIHELCTLINANRLENATLTSAIRAYLISYYRGLAEHGVA